MSPRWGRHDRLDQVPLGRWFGALVGLGLVLLVLAVVAEVVAGRG